MQLLRACNAAKPAIQIVASKAQHCFSSMERAWLEPMTCATKGQHRDHAEHALAHTLQTVQLGDGTPELLGKLHSRTKLDLPGECGAAAAGAWDWQ